MADKVFANAREFALFMERAAAVELFADTAGRAQVCIKVVEGTKERIGDPQRLPPELAPATQVQRERLGYAPDETLLREGGLRDSYKWAHESTRKTVAGSDSEVALYQELGTTRGVPARYPLTRAVTEDEPELFARYVEVFDGLFELR